jgi:small subunit ribosomal protein S2
MEPFLFGARNGVHIIDLEQTVPLLARALESIRDTAAGGGRGRAVRSVFRDSPLAGRHADQLADHHQVDQAPARAG